MSTAALKQVATGQVQEKPKDLAHLMASPQVQAQLKAALPRHLTAERMARIATTEMRKVPKLAQCDPMSFLGAVIQCAQLGLEPGNALGHAYILPFDKSYKEGNAWKKRTEAQVIIGYRGMIDLARRSGQIVSIEARAVYEGDHFECELGLESKVKHVPDWQNPNRANSSKLRFVYAVAKLKDGGVQFDIMSRAEVDGIMARSQGYQSAQRNIAKGEKGDNPWLSDYSSMALKTVVRRLFKFLPVSIEIQTAVGLDELAEAGVSQQNSAIIDGNFQEVDTPMSLENSPRETAAFNTHEVPEPAYAPQEPMPPQQSAPEMQQDGPSPYDVLFNRIRSCKDAEILDLVVDEIRYLDSDEEKKKLYEYAKERRTELEK